MEQVKVTFAPEYGVGTTDAEDTYCCELTPSWFVTFPDDEPGNGHYFHVKDLEVLQ